MDFQARTITRTENEDWPGLRAITKEVSRHLSIGGLLVHPTTGVYGLGGAFRKDVEACLAHVKHRAGKTGFVYLVADAAAARAHFPHAEWTRLAARLAEEFWPGPLTLVLDDGSAAGVAIRAEAHPVTRAVLGSWAGPISSTSLNLSGSPAATSGAEARDVLRSMPAVDRPVLCLDVGSLPGPPASTLVRVGEDWEVLREGAVSSARILSALS